MVRNERQSGSIGRSLLALLAGFAVNVALALGADQLLRVTGVFPTLGMPMSDGLFLLATAYRTLFAVIAAYVIARLAPNRPMQHALAGGVIGLVLSLAGAVATWNRDLGPHWYPLTLVVLALPTAWAGGKLRVLQLAGMRSRSGELPTPN